MSNVSRSDTDIFVNHIALDLIESPKAPNNSYIYLPRCTGRNRVYLVQESTVHYAERNDPFAT